ncbi:MAG: molybdenum cofactor biosynthesis protein MoaE [Acidimicrobiales bacterium]
MDVEGAGPAERDEAPVPHDWVPAERGDVWVSLATGVLSVERAASWATRPDCGAVVVFAGTVRDHAEGRPGVSELEYEAYASQVEPRMMAIARDAQLRWPQLGRLVLWHRVGVMALTERSVLVAVSSAHRGDAFDAARYCIDTLKRTVPIWKRERWAGGEDWGQDAHEVEEVGS